MTSTLTPPERTAPASGPATRRPPVPQGPLRLRSSRPDQLVCLALLLAIGVVQGVNIAGFPSFSDDEGTYLAQAWAVQQGEGLAHYTYWYDHPPLGWIQLALLTWIPAWIAPESMTVGAMRSVMLLVTLVTAVLLYVLARRLALPRWTAALAVGLFGLSPLSVELHREIFLDNIAVAWILAAFVLAASPSRHLWHHFAAGMCAAVAVLSKETMLLVLPAVLFTLWRHSHRDTRKFAVSGALTSCALIGLLYPLFALLNHELLPGRGHVSLWDGVVYQLSRPGSGSVFVDGSGADKVVDSWLYYDRVLPLAGLAAALLLAACHRWSVTARATAGPAFVVVLLGAVAAFRTSGYLPDMYIIQALPFLALCLAAVAASVRGLLARRLPRTAGAAVFAALLLTGAFHTVPQWYEGGRTAMTDDPNASFRAAAAWMDPAAGHVSDPAGTRVLVDDSLWLDLVHHGYRPGTGAIWFYKADLDPAVTEVLDRGWRDVDYVISTPTVRRDAKDLPTVADSLRNSEAVATFGEGAQRVEIRRTTGGDRR
ncbi:ArnT family glycosyltransferase [Streptomyces sp. SP18CS02]|uniref:ArnT family glycosyltransferase n=1 Tax=Streptomyces sp. SP18CS02 TaxID=3002531 RepID=UPI002E792EE9|nr:phospholipid carrier-dependent glycosyltransferase [Streptomyces sp. SP18CS02]MEE1756261.1 glycosyltransferase family 39 protein [Streptomyces sp. SP18CS02]